MASDDLNTPGSNLGDNKNPPEKTEDSDIEEVGLEDDSSVASAPPEVPLVQLESFAAAELHPDLTKVIQDLGWDKPTMIQSLCLPLTLKGRDLAGFAQTGTGKTGVFLITCCQRLLTSGGEQRTDRGVAAPECLVLVPTRELAMQINQDGRRFFDPLKIASLAVFGGIDYEKQAAELAAHPRFVVATPGRLKDFFQKKMISLKNCQVFICDEADRMFDMGFIDDVTYFLDKTAETTQKLLFSATTNEEVKELAFEYLDKPQYISANPEELTPEKISQHALICDTSNKLRVMIGLLREHAPECSIVFTNTKLTAEWLHYKLQGNGIECDLITGDLPQNKRINLINRIKEGKVKALIATDVASRGLHISKVTHVYNFDLPDDSANYVHRIGRTARAGASGFAYSLVCEDYGQNLLPIQEMLGEKVPLRAVWFEPKYLEIEDKAGNPFAPGERLARKPTRPGSGPRPDGRKGAESGQRRGRPGPAGDFGGKGRRGEEPRRDMRGGKDHRGPQRHGEQNQQNRGRRPDGPQHGHHKKKHPQHDRHQHQQHRQQHHSAAARHTGSKTAIQITKPSVWGLFKKLLATIFGWRK